jgi:hypothetical protein
MKLRTPIITLLLLTGVSSALAQNAIPKQLAGALEKHGCKEIVNHTEFQNLDPMGRWWISLQEFTGSDSDFVFFCHDLTDHLATRFVVEAKADRSPWKACRSAIEEWRDLVRPQLENSLEIVKVSSIDSGISDLGRWWLADASRRTNFTYGPKGTKVPELIIDTTGGSGSGSLYACYEGKWYTISLD